MGFPETKCLVGDRKEDRQRTWDVVSGLRELTVKDSVEHLDDVISSLCSQKVVTNEQNTTCTGYRFGSLEVVETPWSLESSKEDSVRRQNQAENVVGEDIQRTPIINWVASRPGASCSDSGEDISNGNWSKTKLESKYLGEEDRDYFTYLNTETNVNAVERNALYKTELCRSFMETGFCRYGSKCQFAHGSDELRQIKRHPKYKTRYCRNFMKEGSCPYGSRCRFIHKRRGSFDGLETDLLYAVEGLLPAKNSSSPRNRLPIFQKLQEEDTTDNDI
eukprot:jgi/Galph1/3452/GphlegSOOS_G2077.1